MGCSSGHLALCPATPLCHPIPPCTPAFSASSESAGPCPLLAVLGLRNLAFVGYPSLPASSGVPSTRPQPNLVGPRVSWTREREAARLPAGLRMKWKPQGGQFPPRWGVERTNSKMSSKREFWDKSKIKN